MVSTSPSFPPTGERPPLAAAVHGKLRKIGGLDGLEAVEFRQLRKKDRKELEALHREWFPVEYGKSFYDEVFESKRVGSVAALLGDLLLGAATFRTHFQQSRFDMESVVEGGVDACMNGAAGYILTLGVVDAARGHGLAKQLLQKTMDSIRQQLGPKLKAIWVHVVEYNAPAISLYEHMGLQMVRHFPRFYCFHNQYWDSLLYVLYENGGRPPNDLKAQVWRDEMLAMLASLSHPQEVHRRCQAWFSCCFTSCARRRRKVK